MNTKGERVNFLRKKNDKSYNDLALLVGNIKADGMRKAIVDDFISERQITILCDKLGWDKNWILNGGEEPKNLIVSEPQEEYKIDKNHFKAVPFYNLNVSAGDIVFLDNGLLENQQPDDFMYIPKNIDADVAFPTYGHSMYPGLLYYTKYNKYLYLIIYINMYLFVLLKKNLYLHCIKYHLILKMLCKCCANITGELSAGVFRLRKAFVRGQSRRVVLCGKLSR